MEEVAAVLISVEALAVALFALLILYTLRPQIQFVVYAVAAGVEQVPVVGGDLASSLRNSVDSLYSYMGNTFSSWAQSAVSPLTNFMTANAHIQEHVALTLDQHRNVVYLSMRALLNTITNNSQSFTSDYVDSNLSGIQAWTSNLVNTEAVDTREWVTAWNTQIEAWADDGINRVESYAHSIGDELTSQLQTVTTLVENDYNQAIAYSQQLYQQGVTFTESSITATRNQLEGTITDVDTSIRGLIGDVETWAEQRMGAIQGQIDGQIVPVISLVLGTTIPLVATIAEKVTSCLDPMCNSGPAFFKGVDSILNMLGDLAMIAFLAAAIKEPDATAAVTVDTVNGIATAAANTFESIVGV